MKIGIDIRNIGKKRTGDEAVFFNLVKSLAGIDRKNEYRLFTDITDASILHDAVSAPLKIAGKSNFKIVPLETSSRFAWNFWTLPRYLRKKPVDVYLTQYITPWFVPQKIKMAAIVHDVSFKAYPQKIKFFDLFFLNLLLPHSFRRAGKIIGVSQFTADEIKKYYAVDPAKISWIHNAVDPEFIERSSQSSPADLEKIRSEYNLPEKFILYIGTLQPRKNLPALIEAFVRLPAKIRGDHKLVLAGGKGSNYDLRIDSFIKNLKLEDQVILPGYITEKDKAAVFRLASIFCFPSLYEGFGIPILEAFAAGVPVAASNIPPHVEICADAALLFDPQKSSAISESLTRLLVNESLQKSLTEKGGAQVRNFSWEKTAAKILELLVRM